MAAFDTAPLPLSSADAGDLRDSVQTEDKEALNEHLSVEVKSLSKQILTQRRNRLEKQNKKLDFEIVRLEQQYGDIAQFERDVQRMNVVVMQTLFAMANRIAEPLAAMDDPGMIRDYLREQLREAFNDLAYNHARHGHQPD